MSKALFLAAVLLGLLLGGFLIGRGSVPSWGPPRTYKLYVGPQPIGSFKGQAVRSNGFCIEVLLNGRVDTIACANTVITESIETTGAPDAQVQPTRQQ